MLISSTKFRANDDEDIVNITVGEIRVSAWYQTAFEISQHLRLACKSAARYDHAPGSFWLDVDTEDLADCPATHRSFRRSKQVQNFSNCSTRFQKAEVCLLFDGVSEIFGYEDGIKLHQMIRRAARRAKACAVDTTTGRKILANLTDAASQME